MAKKFIDFQFNNKKLSDLSVSYIAANFNDSDDSLGLAREVVAGERNRYRVEPNSIYTKWSGNISFELNIMKDPCKYANQDDLVIKNSEIREITRWLTSSHSPKWINFTYDPKATNEDVPACYRGHFVDVTRWEVGGNVYGLILNFECTTPFGYTEEIATKYECSGYRSETIFNDSDELEDYAYPILEIEARANTDFVFINVYDMNVLESGAYGAKTLTQYIEDYARVYRYSIEYPEKKSFCNNTMIEFTYVDISNNRTKCTAFVNNGYYFIVSSGVFRFSTLKALRIHVDCQKLLIYDNIGRMITYDDLGVVDADSIYWPRLQNGLNEIIIYCEGDVTIKRRESRKIGA